MNQARRRARRFLIRSWPLLCSLALLGGTPLMISLNRYGHVAVQASVFLPDMVLQVPYVRPVMLVTSAPRREHVTIEYESRNGPRSIEADLYVPAHGVHHEGVVFSMGTPPLPLDDSRLVRIAEDVARSGVVILVPFSDRLDELRIEPEEIDALVAEYKYVQALPEVNPRRVGFFGASVGGSLALVAAADPRIADAVDHVVSFGGYFDALQTFGTIATRHIRYDGVDEAWTPHEHAQRVMAQQIIDRVDDANDQAALSQEFEDGTPLTPEQVAGLGPAGRGAYGFLSNRDPARVPALIAGLPQGTVAELNELSPKTSIGRVKAELFIVHDRGDPMIPYTESRGLKAAVGDRPTAHFDELRLFEHVEPKLNQRPEVLALDGTRLLFRLYQLLLRWN
jgi:dienelactone hydrolase